MLFFLSFLLLGCHLLSATCTELLSRHRRAWIIDSFTIEEENPGPFPYVLGQINIDRNYQVHFDLYGEGVDVEPRGVLSIHKDSGTIYVHRAVDYEEKKMIKLKFESRKQDYSTDTKLVVEISIRDINDNPPQFQRDLYEISVKEEVAQGSYLMAVSAYDIDQKGTPNSTFHYEIKHVSPNVPDTEFFIEKSGAISFKGCLDHEVADKYLILVEAIDHGEVVSLSSSTSVVVHIQDGNNHLPTITAQTGPGRVKEGAIGISPLRLHVTDRDVSHSPAWRARFTIHGDKGSHFTIQTDPDSNDGILEVVRPLDFEEGSQVELTISVENELPFFFCQVKKKTTTGLWMVDNGTDDDPGGGHPDSVKVIINVEDINDPPVFSVDVKEAYLQENAPIGTWVEKVTAADPDSSQGNDFVYKVENDPAGWVTVDPHTGEVTTVKSLDRESTHVTNNIYTILLHAVDNGEPPMTGTATLHIHVTDQNDNTPQPVVNYLDVCTSDSPTITNITAMDLDEDPFAGPFTFELMGDMEKWRLNPSCGYTASLVKDPSVYAGEYTINVKISDLQGAFGIYNLSVTVCDCSVTSNCQIRRITAAKAAFGAIGVVLASLILLLCLLLLTVVCSCKRKFISLETTSAGQSFLESNTEKLGTDCEVLDSVLQKSPEKLYREPSGLSDGSQKHFSPTTVKKSSPGRSVMQGMYRQEDELHIFTNTKQGTWSSAVNHYDTHQHKDMEFFTQRKFNHLLDDTVVAVLQQRLTTLQEIEDEPLDYEPYLYADEGELDTLSELETITISDDDSLEKALNELDSKFNQLASICQN